METYLRKIRDELMNAVLRGMIILIIPAMIASTIRFAQTGWNYIYTLHFILTVIGILIFLFRKKLPLELKAHSIFIILVLICFAGSIKFGMSAELLVYFIPITLSALIFGKRTGLIYLAIVTSGLIVIGYLHVYRIIHTEIDFNIYNFNITTWINHIVAVVFLMLVVIYAIGLFYNIFLQNIQTLLQKNNEQYTTQQALKENEALIKMQNEELQSLNAEYLIAKENAEKNENTIKKQSEEIETFFTCAIDLLCIANTEGYFIRLNKEWEKTLGYSLGELEGRKFLDFVHPDDLESTYQAIAQLDKQLEVISFTNRYQCKNGTYKWIEWKSYPNGNKIYAAARDITKRILMENELVRAKEKVEESEEKFRAIFQESKVVKLLIDAENGQIIDANPTAINFYGYEKEQLLSLNISNINRLSKEQMQKDMSLAFKDQKNTYYRKHCKANGDLVDVEVYSSLIKIKDRQVFYSLIIDITERNRAKEELIKSKENALKNESKLKEAQKLAKIGSWELELDTTKLYWSDEIYRIFGYQPQEFEITYEAFLTFVHPDDLDFVNSSYANHLKTKQPYNVVHRILLPDNTIKYVNERCESDFDEFGNPVRSIGTVADITELKEIEEKLIQNEKELKKVQEITHSGSFYIDLATNKVTWSEELYRMYGFDPAFPPPLLDESQTLFTQQSWNLLNSSITKAVTDGTSYEIELKMIRKDKTSGWMWARGEAISNKEGKTVAIWGAVQDISERKNLEEELILAKEKAEESEKKLLSIYNTVGNIIYLVSVEPGDNYRFVSVNDEFLKVTGLRKAQVVGKYMSDVIPKPSLDLVLSNFTKAIQEKKIVRWEETSKYPTGDLTGIVGISPIFDPSGKCTFLVGAVHDITERKKAELEIIAAKNKIEESEEKYRLIAENVSDVIWILNLETKKFSYISPSVFQLRGYTVEEAMAQDMLQSVTPDSAQFLMERLPARIQFYISNPENNCADLNQIQQPCKDGSIIWVEASTHFQRNKAGEIEIFGISRNITERKRIEDELKKSLLKAEENELRFKTMFTEAPLGIALIDSLNGRIYEVNQKFAEIAGRTRDEMITIDWMSITHPDDIQEDLDNMALLNAGKITGFTMQKRYIKPNGFYVWINMTIAPIFVQDKKNPRHLCMIEDITERKQAEENIKKSLREKETLLREIYHRTKNTMQVINGIIQLQASEFPGNLELQKLVRCTENRIQAISLVHQMLYRSQDLSQISIKEYIQNLSDLVFKGHGISNDRIIFNFNIIDKYILLDTVIPLGLILNELITNSLKYAFPDERKGIISISLLENESENTVLRYSDNGVGVPDGFDFRNNNTLGLILVYSIGEQQMLGKAFMENKKWSEIHFGIPK